MTQLVCYTAVFSVVTRGTLRDDTKNGCVVDYDTAPLKAIGFKPCLLLGDSMGMMSLSILFMLERDNGALSIGRLLKLDRKNEMITKGLWHFLPVLRRAGRFPLLWACLPSVSKVLDQRSCCPSQLQAPLLPRLKKYNRLFILCKLTSLNSLITNE